MTIEKLEYTRTDGSYSPSSSAVIGKLNEIIDHLNSKEVFPDTGKKVESKQELVPLDVDALAERIAIQAIDYKYTIWSDVKMLKKNIIPEISKYGVHRRSEPQIIAWRENYCNTHMVVEPALAVVQFAKENGILQE